MNPRSAPETALAVQILGREERDVFEPDGDLKRAARVDANQKEIVAAFRKFGCSVLLLHTVGGGCPDIAVGLNRKTVLVEIKDGSKPKSQRALTKDEQAFFDTWNGSLFVVESLEDVINLVRALEK